VAAARMAHFPKQKGEKCCFVPRKKKANTTSETRLWEQAALPSHNPTHIVREAAGARFPAGFSTDGKEDAPLPRPKLEHEHAPGPLIQTTNVLR